MKHFLLILSLLAPVAMAQTELNLKKFRFSPGTSENLERLVLEFSGPAIKEEAEVKKVQSGTEQDVSIRISNVQWMGAIPESQINESCEKSRKMMGPIVINTDSPKNGFTLRTLIKNPENEVDAFWLANPTRLVVDVFSKTSPRMANRNYMPSSRKTASVKPSKKSRASVKAPEPKNLVPEAKLRNEFQEAKPESIFCFLAKAQMSPSVAYEPWSNSTSTIPLAVRNPSAAEGELKEGIVCFPATSRVHPQLNFDKSEASPFVSEPRNPASESKPKAFNPTTSEKEDVPPSLGANFEKAVKRANPSILLPPYQ